ncbi:MAG: DUF3626 domain-containing protein [Pseudomonadota bacterium]
MNTDTQHLQSAELLPYQQNAIEHIEQQATHSGQLAGDCIDAILARARLTRDTYDNAIAAIGSYAQIAVHFHPERLSRSGESVAEGLLQSGLYKNQFETGLSGGSPSAFAGGERDLWERHLFGGAYHGENVLPAGRPKYGALQLISHPDGPAPRFGSCYFLLNERVCERATFTFGGSQEQDALARTGTLKMLEPIIADIFSELELGRDVFGVGNLSVAGFLDNLITSSSAPVPKPQNLSLGRALDSFVETQIHGEICLAKDVAAMVVDPAFHNHHIGEVLKKISLQYGIPLRWHPGFTLPVSQVPKVFRGYSIAPLAHRVAGNGLLDALNVGKLANSLELEPERWKDWASYEDTLTQFRRLWHFMVLNGSPREAHQHPSELLSPLIKPSSN